MVSRFLWPIRSLFSLTLYVLGAVFLIHASTPAFASPHRLTLDSISFSAKLDAPEFTVWYRPAEFAMQTYRQTDLQQFIPHDDGLVRPAWELLAILVLTFLYLVLSSTPMVIRLP